MARVALVLLALALLVPGGGAPEGQTTPDTLVQVAWAGAPLATRLLRERGGMPLAPGLGIWRARPEVARELATRGLLRVSEPDRPAVSLRATVPPDPYTLAQWWRSAVGADRIEPPGPGKPVTVVPGRTVRILDGLGIDFGRREGRVSGADQAPHAPA